MKLQNIDDLKNIGIEGKVIFVRADLNVPMKDGKISDNTRIARFAKTAIEISKANAKVVITSHMGRPTEAKEKEYSLSQIVNEVSNCIGKEVNFIDDCIGDKVKTAISNMQNGDIILLENLRYYKAEEKNEEDFAKELSKGFDYYVNDAFSCSHRSHASTYGITKFLPAFAGRLMEEELNALESVLKNPKKPVCAIAAGSKVSTKLDVLKNLSEKVDYLIVGGGIDITFNFEAGYKVGKSVCEKDMVNVVKEIRDFAKKNNCEIITSIDCITAPKFETDVETKIKSISDISDDEMIVDIGPKSTEAISKILEKSKTVLMNGPVGAFEIPEFAGGTICLINKIAKLTEEGNLTSVAGGGDTVNALKLCNAKERFSYVSTAGGAFLEYIEGKELPPVNVLYR